MHDVTSNSPTGEDSDWPELRTRLWRGMQIHLSIFVSATLMLFVINWLTRGEDGSWWIVGLLQLWAAAWALHVLGVAGAYASRRRTN